jgi:spore coat protein U-like protein
LPAAWKGNVSLAYNIYTNSARTSVLDTGSGGTLNVVAPLNGLLVFGTSIIDYGCISAKQWVKADAYSDSIVVTITY